MIAYFPRPLPDESFYSWLSRYAFHTFETSPLVVNQQIFGKSKVNVSFEFATKLSEFKNRVGHLLNITECDIIDHHTNFPFYKHFTVEPNLIEIRKRMIQGGNGNIGGLFGLNASGVKPLSSPRFCIECAEQDKEKFHEIYWHRVHQLPISVCPVHTSYITEFNIPATQLKSAQFHYTSSLTDLNAKSRKCTNQLLLEISQFSKDLLEGGRIISIEKNDYKKILVEKGYYNGSKLLIDQVVKAITNLHGSESIAEWLLSFNCRLSFKEVIQHTLYKGSNIFNPGRHMLLQLSLSTIAPLAIENNLQFGSGPWRCYNKCSNHYLQFVVTKYELSYSSKLKQRIGIFKCDCGMIYKRFIRDIAGSKKVVTKIIDFGIEWMAKFEEARRHGRSAYSLGKEFGISVGQAKSHIKRLSAKLLQSQNVESVDEVKQNMRGLWENLLTNGDHKSPNEARMVNPKLYYWLNKYDPSWLKEINIKHARRSRNYQLRIDWKKADQRILRSVRSAYESLRENAYTKRITKTLLLRMVAKERYFTKGDQLKRLTHTVNFINEVVEDEFKYQSRRIEIAYNFLSGEKTFNKVVRKSGIKKLLPAAGRKLENLLMLNR